MLRNFAVISHIKVQRVMEMFICSMYLIMIGCDQNRGGCNLKKISSSSVVNSCNTKVYIILHLFVIPDCIWQ